MTIRVDATGQHIFARSIYLPLSDIQIFGNGHYLAFFYPNVSIKDVC